tara:strand:- start:525 stop:875 length:351 start_codon:yes stop_codon:yes gene_type:complete
MCLGMGGGSRQPVQQELPERNAAPTVTGEQTGVDNPKDTKKATDELMIKRQKEEGRYNPESTNTTTSSRLSSGSGGMNAVERNQRSARLRGKLGPTKAQSLAKARMKSKRSKTRTA